eukprot:snap_masked-scaffold_4-processed-gene-12.35-mRNA-1 protein AED:0.09 eAED:0.09 QI:0/-1/0/1/-1/1/1/0/535
MEEDAKSFLENIFLRIKSLFQEPVSEKLLSHLVKHYITQNNIEQEKVNEEQKENLVKDVISYLNSEDDPVLELIKLKVNFDAFVESKGFKEEKNVLVEEILDIDLQYGSEFELVNKAYKLVFDLVYEETQNRFGVEYPPFLQEEEIIRNEISSCLSSVLPRLDIKTLLMKDKEAIREQLEETVLIVLGIRLYYKRQKQTIGLCSFFQKTKNLWKDEKNIEVMLNKATKEKDEVSLAALYSKKFSDSESEYLRLRNILSYLDMAESCLKKVIQQERDLKSRLSNIGSVYRDTLFKTVDMMNSKSSLSKAVVYPMFDLLGRSYIELFRIYTQTNHFLRSLKTFLPHSYKLKYEVATSLLAKSKQHFLEDKDADVLFGQLQKELEDVKEYLFQILEGKISFEKPVGSIALDEKSIEGSNSVEKREISTETPVHFNKGYIDKNYEWNEWKIKERIIRIANLSHTKSRTISTQTMKSKSWRDTDSQIYLPQAYDTQTAIHKNFGNPNNFWQICSRKQSSNFELKTLKLDIEVQDYTNKLQ